MARPSRHKQPSWRARQGATAASDSLLHSTRDPTPIGARLFESGFLHPRTKSPIFWSRASRRQPAGTVLFPAGTVLFRTKQLCSGRPCTIYFGWPRRSAEWVFWSLGTEVKLPLQLRRAARPFLRPPLRPSASKLACSVVLCSLGLFGQIFKSAAGDIPGHPSAV